MKRAMYGTILLFVLIIVVVIVISLMNPVKTVRYEDGVIIEEEQ